MIFNSIKEKFIFYNFPVFLFSLLPLFLITGPFLSDMSLSLISLLFLIYCMKKKNFFFFKNKYFYFFLIFWLYLLLNSLMNNFNFDSLKISFFYFRYGVFVIALVSLLDVNDKFIKYFFYCIFLCFFILIVDGFYQYFMGENILGWKTNNSSRISSFFGEELILGSYLSKLWPIFFGLSIFFFKKEDKIFFIFVLFFILSEVLIFLSGERTAFFLINLSAIFVILFSDKLFKLRLTILVFSLFLISIISIFNPTAKERIIDKTISQMNIKDNKINIFNPTAKEKIIDQTISQINIKDNKINIFTRQHTHHYFTAYKMFLDNKILGVGVKNFRKFCGEDKYQVSNLSCSTHPHNTYIQILAETGIIGFLFLVFVFLLFILFLLKHLFLKFKGKYFFTDFEICILSGIAIFLWPFVPTGNVFNNWLNIIICLYPILLIWSRNQKKLISN